MEVVIDSRFFGIGTCFTTVLRLLVHHVLIRVRALLLIHHKHLFLMLRQLSCRCMLQPAVFVRGTRIATTSICKYHVLGWCDVLLQRVLSLCGGIRWYESAGVLRRLRGLCGHQHCVIDFYSPPTTRRRQCHCSWLRLIVVLLYLLQHVVVL